MIWRVGEDGESGAAFTPWTAALTGGQARACQLSTAIGIAKGLPLAAGSMAVAHATRICPLVLILPFSPASPTPLVWPNVRFPDRGSESGPRHGFDRPFST